MIQRKFTLLGLAALLAVGTVSAQNTQDTVVFPRNSVWKYLDNGSDQGTAWTGVSFNDASWSSGPAELGYGDGNEATVVSFGSSSSNKYPCTYFRTTFNLTTLPAIGQSVVVRLQRDDGAVVYINGTEAFRDNMPSGTINYLTWATATVDGGNESTYFDFPINGSLLQLGNNTIAVQIHQDRATSSDISFNFELVYRSYKPPVNCDSLIDTLHISHFKSVVPSVQPDSIRIPYTHTFQMIVQSGDPYTDTAHGVTKGLFDFTGYVPIEGSSENGYLSINHELGSFPAAGVSMLSINFDTVAHIWNVTNNVPVDFTPVMGTGRNCSGTVTPWNTIITTEETLPSRDDNSDGYQDIGWLVEIDPVTATVMSYNGVQKKLWRMGRMSHENVVVSPIDRKTAYLTNDENPGYVFKYVANTPEDMSEGLLYVLKLDGPLDATTTGKWIGIPNFTPADCNNARSYANSVGATNFNQLEDIEISPLNGMCYFTSKASSRVYRFMDDGLTVSGVEVFVGNSASKYVIDSDTGLVEEQWRGGVDNLTFDDLGNLYVLQDGDRNHIWMVPPCHSQTNPAVKLFCVTPAGCEPTGMTFSPDYRFMFVSMQHPSSSNTTEMIDATGTPVKFNKESAIVIARKEFLGPDALVNEPPIDDTTIQINEPKVNEILNVYPNPTTGKVNINISSNTNTVAVLRVYNVLGANVRVLSKRLHAGENIIEVDMNNLPSGIYTASLIIDGKITSAKIVKK